LTYFIEGKSYNACFYPLRHYSSTDGKMPKQIPELLAMLIASMSRYVPHRERGTHAGSVFSALHYAPMRFL